MTFVRSLDHVGSLEKPCHLRGPAVLSFCASPASPVRPRRMAKDDPATAGIVIEGAVALRQDYRESKERANVSHRLVCQRLGGLLLYRTDASASELGAGGAFFKNKVSGSPGPEHHCGLCSAWWLGVSAR